MKRDQAEKQTAPSSCPDQIHPRRHTMDLGLPSETPQILNRTKQAQINVSTATVRFKQYLQENKDLARRIRDSEQKVENDINEHFKAIVIALEEKKRCLLLDVKDICSARIDKVEVDRANAERTINTFKQCQKQLKSTEKIKPWDENYTPKVNAVCSMADAIINNIPPEVDTNLSWMEYVPETTACRIQYGSLKMERTVELELESEFGKTWFSGLGNARGVALTRTGLLAVAESSSSRVSLWENKRGEYQRKICIKTPWYSYALQKPIDVAETSEGNFVVVDDTNTVKILSESGKFDENEWAKEEGTTCVTTNLERKQILMDSEKKIAMYDLSGHELPPIWAGITSQAITTYENKVAITNGKEVRMFDMDSGEMLLSFKARIRGLCFDAKTDSILATTFDRQICQYCAKTGQRLAVVSPECLHDPWGLVIIPGRKLAVADDQSVKVYQIRDHFINVKQSDEEAT